MWWIIGISFFAGLILYCACVVGSNADDAEEKWWKEHKKDFKKGEDNDAN